MLVKLALPLISQDMLLYEIQKLYLQENEYIKRGSRLLDFKAQMTNDFAHDCPSINFYRIVSQESFWVRKILVAPREQVNPNHLVAILSADEYESLEDFGSITKVLKITYAGIVHEVDWFGLG